MNEREIVELGLNRLAALMGVASLALDEGGMCTLVYQDAVSLTIIAPERTGTLYLSVAILPVPAGDRQAFYERLLQLNFLLVDTNGATLSLDDDAKEVHLCFAMNLEHFDEEAFPALVGNLVQAASRLRMELQQPVNVSISSTPGFWVPLA